MKTYNKQASYRIQLIKANSSKRLTRNHWTHLLKLHKCTPFTPLFSHNLIIKSAYLSKQIHYSCKIVQIERQKKTPLVIKFFSFRNILFPHLKERVGISILYFNLSYWYIISMVFSKPHRSDTYIPNERYQIVVR